MPSADQHVSQAAHNIDFLESFCPTYKYNDWSITVAFYACIHIIEAAIFKKKKINYKNKAYEISHAKDLILLLKREEPGLNPHSARNAIVEQDFPEIANRFLRLYRSSITARYKRYFWKDHEVNEIVKPTLKDIIQWSNKDFSTTFKLSL